MNPNVQRKKSQRRSQIIESLIPLISSVPFEDIHVVQLCEEANISIGSFYHYFNSKNDILSGLMLLIDEYMENTVFPLLNNEDEPENLMIFANGWAEHVNQNGIKRSILISQIEPRDEDYVGNKRSSVMKIEEIIRRGQEKGQITTMHPAEELSSMFLLAIRGVTTDWSRCGGSYSVVDRMHLYISLFIKALRA